MGFRGRQPWGPGVVSHGVQGSSAMGFRGRQPWGPGVVSHEVQGSSAMGFRERRSTAPRTDCLDERIPQLLEIDGSLRHHVAPARVVVPHQLPRPPCLAVVAAAATVVCGRQHAISLTSMQSLSSACNLSHQHAISLISMQSLSSACNLTHRLGQADGRTGEGSGDVRTGRGQHCLSMESAACNHCRGGSAAGWRRADGGLAAG